MDQNKCTHINIHFIYSPDDSGWYCECLNCWKTFPLAPTRKEAHQKYKEAVR